MMSKAVKRNVSDTSYLFASIDDDTRGAFVDGMTYLNRLYAPGDRIAMDRGWVEVVEAFDGFDYHDNRPCHCFLVKDVCHHCGQLVTYDEYLGQHQRYYGMICMTTTEVKVQY